MLNTKRILIVDNDPDTLDAMQEMFIYQGFEVRTLLEPDSIFNVIAEYHPDIVLVDFILNGINGGEICHQIKVGENTCHIPVIIVSAYSKVLQSLGYYGCDAFIAKPFDMNNLIDNVSGLLRTRLQA